MELRIEEGLVDASDTPQGWTSVSINEIGTIKTGPFGTLLKAHEYSEGEGTPLISVREIREGHIQLYDETPRVPPTVVRRLPEYVLREGDIVFGRKGAVDRSALVRAHQDGWFLGSDGIRLRVFEPGYPGYIAYHFQGNTVQAWLLNQSTGTTMATLNQSILNRVSIPLPPPKEQRAIAAALSDVDALIAALDRLIAKKRAVKTAAMQQLLTGRQRLPGFSETWETKTLGDIATINMGQSPSSKFYNRSGDGLPLIQGNADLVDRKSIARVWTTHAPKQCSAGHLLLTVRAPVGYVGVATKKACLGRGVCAVDSNTVNLLYLFHTLVFAEPRWQAVEQGSTFTSANSRQISKFEVDVPPSNKEQRAIAAVLSDMDAEIDALEVRRDKTKQIKQGMMQELLTGRTRLVQPA